MSRWGLWIRAHIKSDHYDPNYVSKRLAAQEPRPWIHMVLYMRWLYRDTPRRDYERMKLRGTFLSYKDKLAGGMQGSGAPAPMGAGGIQ